MRAAKNWVVYSKHECINKNEALYLERFIKRMKSKKFILKAIQYPKILNDILNKK